MEKQISIIIPTYNMERYLAKCLDSLLIPEIDDVEVLVVNDGSKDRSSEIAHSYADRYPQSIKVIDKANGNYGSCINAALPVATGRYVKVLDADDSFNTTAFSEFVRLLPTLNDDVLITPFCIVNEAGDVTKIQDFKQLSNIDFNQTYSFIEAYRHNLIVKYGDIQMHSIAYRRAIFSKFEYKQTEGISFTDVEWALWPLIHSETIHFIELKPLYKYLVGREGQTVDIKRFQGQIDSYITLFKNAVSYYNSFNGEKFAKELIFIRLFDHIKYIYIRSKKVGDILANKKLAEFDKSLQGLCPKLYEDLGNDITYQPKYRYIKQWREKGYPLKLDLSFFERLQISLFVRTGIKI